MARIGFARCFYRPFKGFPVDVNGNIVSVEILNKQPCIEVSHHFVTGHGASARTAYHSVETAASALPCRIHLFVPVVGIGMLMKAGLSHADLTVKQRKNIGDHPGRG